MSILEQLRNLDMNEYLGEYSDHEDSVESSDHNEDNNEPLSNLQVDVEELSDLDEDTPPGYRERSYDDSYYRPERNIVLPEGMFGSRSRRRRKDKSSSHKRDYKRKIPEKYRPYGGPQSYEDKILNLDCKLDNNAEIDGFFRRMKLIIATNPAQFETFENVDNYLEYNMYGSARKFFENTISERNELAKDKTKAEYLDVLARYFNFEFGGEEEQNRAAVEANKISKANYALTNIKLCDICYWKEFSCEYTYWYYCLPRDQQLLYKNQFYDKLNPMWAELMKKRWLKKPSHISDTLGGKIKLLQEELEKKCNEDRFHRETARIVNNQPCCNPEVLELPGEYGCHPTSSHKSKRDKKYIKREGKYRRKRRFRKYVPRYRRTRRMPRMSRRRYNRPVYRRRRYPYRKLNETKEEENCPRGKKNCKCWICKEEGHYANECPNKSKNKEQAKMLEQILTLEFEPIENLSDSESEYSEYEIDIKIIEKDAYESEVSDGWEPIDESSEDEWHYA